MIKLKKCTFCGLSVAKIRDYPSIIEQHTVLCGMLDGGCGAGTKPYLGKKETKPSYAVELWNTRIDTPRSLNNKNLKNCPHCGETDVELIFEDKLFHIKCNDCETRSGGYLIEKDAIGAWNREAK